MLHIMDFGNRGLLFRVLLLSVGMEALAMDVVYQIPFACQFSHQTLLSPNQVILRNLWKADCILPLYRHRKDTFSKFQGVTDHGRMTHLSPSPL